MRGASIPAPSIPVTWPSWISSPWLLFPEAPLTWKRATPRILPPPAPIRWDACSSPTRAARSTVKVPPDSTVALAEGLSQSFKALATFSDSYTEQVACDGLLGATTWNLTGTPAGVLTLGACAANSQTVNAGQIPCSAGGSGTVNATYSGMSDGTATAVTVTNDDEQRSE